MLPVAKTDGTEYVHTIARSQELRDTTHYDRVWKLISYTRIKMYGDHSHPKGMGEFTFYDPNNVIVGSVAFDGKGDFLAGTFYGNMVTSGRTRSKTQAFYEFAQHIEEWRRR